MCLPRDANNEIVANQQPWACSYVQIESVTACQSTIPDYFGIKLSFYNREASASKLIVHTFDCKEQIDLDEEREERKAGESMFLSRQATGNIANLFMAGAMEQRSGMRPMEFSVLYLI